MARTAPQNNTQGNGARRRKEKTMKNTVLEWVCKAEEKAAEAGNMIRRAALKKEAGLDGILVTIGLCIIALLLCVVMKDSMTGFIQTLVTDMTARAKSILQGAFIVASHGKAVL
jgi:hypothetical protein